VHQEWQTLVSGIVQEGVASGEFAPPIPVGQAVGALAVLVDGCEMGVAAGSGMTAERYADLLLDTARAVLGVTA
jgi:hypothetical protein